MAHLAINAVSLRMGGAATQLGHLMSTLVQLFKGGQHRITLWRSDTGGERWPPWVEVRTVGGIAQGAAGRMLFDQVVLPAWLARARVDVLLSPGNFGPFFAPCHHVLMVRNPIYFDGTYLRRMRSRSYRAELLLRRWASLTAALHADVVIFPSHSMLEMAARYVGGRRHGWSVIPHGLDHGAFYPAAPAADRLGPTRLLNVSLYSDQKNTTMLLRAMEELERSDPGAYRLTLTMGLLHRDLDRVDTPYARHDRALLDALMARHRAEDIGPVRHDLVPQLYRESDIFVFPSYTESFGQPLAEAMASGLPIVAADTPINREMCGEAALYVQPFARLEYVEAIRRVAAQEDLRQGLIRNGVERAKSFSWERHVHDVLATLSRRRPTSAPGPEVTTA